MSVQITLEDKQIEELIVFYKNKGSSIEEKITQLSEELKVVESILKPLVDSLKGKSKDVKEAPSANTNLFKTNDIDGIEYNKKGSTAKKAEWVLSVSKKELIVKDIIDIIGEKEPYLFNGDKAYRKYNTSMSATLGTKCKNDKVFYRRKNDEDVYVYGLLSWK